MSSCSECHGMAGEKYDDHSTNDCPRWQHKGTDMEPEGFSQVTVTSKPPKHDCTAEIIAELERLVKDESTRCGPGAEHIAVNEVENRITKLKAKETKDD